MLPFILPKLVTAAAIGAAGYAAKKWADGRVSTGDDLPSDDEWERIEARRLAHHRERLASYARTLLAEKGIEHTPEECERLAELLVDPAQWTAFEAMVDELAERARDIREIDASLTEGEQEAAELATLAKALTQLNKDKS